MGKATKKIQFVILNFGYVESSRVASLILRYVGEGFSSEDDALESVSKDLLSLYNLKTGKVSGPQKECCKQHIGKNFCSDCGKNLKEVTISADEFKSWLYDLLTFTEDDIGMDGEELSWRFVQADSLIGRKQNEIFSVGVSAEDEIIDVLQVFEG